jgi:hypothetical protein
VLVALRKNLPLRPLGRRPAPWARFCWKSAMAFLILAWFSGLRASWITFAAMPDAMIFLNMPAMGPPRPSVGACLPSPDERQPSDGSAGR